MGPGTTIAVNGLPDPELTGATSVDVVQRLGATTSYRIRYEVSIKDGDLTRVSDRRLGPGAELGVLVALDGALRCLVRGPVVGHRARLTHGGAGSWVEVEGADRTVVMDRETRSVQWSDVTDSTAVSSIVSGYGHIPDIEPTSGGHFEEKHTLVQRDSDLRFVRRLARRNGYQFWLTSPVGGPDAAHFRRPSLDGAPAATLRINEDGAGTDALDLTWDVERPTSVESAQLDLGTKKDLDGAVARSPLRSLGTRGLGEISPDTRSVTLAAPVDDAGDLSARGEGALIEAGWFVRLRCRTSLDRLGALVRAGDLVDVRGAGRRHSGTYLAVGARHAIGLATHDLDLDLVRNGWSI